MWTFVFVFLTAKSLQYYYFYLLLMFVNIQSCHSCTTVSVADHPCVYTAGQSFILFISEWNVNSYSVGELDKIPKLHHGSEFQHMSLPNSSLNTLPALASRSPMPDGSIYYSQIRRGDGAVIYSCHICGQMLESTPLLQRHMNMLHKNVKALPFSCSICQQGFFSHGGMRTHRLTHCTGRKYTCEVCGFKFLYKHHLKRHEIGVHKMSRCSTCQKLIDTTSFAYHQMNCSEYVNTQ